MQRPQRTYRSFLIRLWWVENAGQPVWRIALQEPGSYALLPFENLPALCAYLATVIGEDERTDDSQRQD